MLLFCRGCSGGGGEVGSRERDETPKNRLRRNAARALRANNMNRLCRCFHMHFDLPLLDPEDYYVCLNSTFMMRKSQTQGNER